MPEPRGILITFEGPEGSGKSTQVDALLERLAAAGIDTVRTREPGGTPTGEAIRDILQHDAAGEPICRETEVLLFAASRAQLVRRIILPALEKGDWVVCDRFADSTTAYQGYGRGFSVEKMIEINSFAIDGAEPALTLLLDIEVEPAMERLHKRNRSTGGELDRIEREAMDFHRRVRDGYLELAERFADRFVVLDATQSPELLAEQIWRHVKPHLNHE